MRPIGIPTITDRVIQFVVKSALEPEWEAKFEASSYGFRPGRQVNDAVGRILRIVNTGSKRWVFEGDLSKCFDCIDHTYLMSQLRHFPGSALIKKWLSSGIFYELVYYDTPEGTPQGSIISPLLCNIALPGLPEEIGIKEWKDGRLFEAYTRGRSLIRYADDFVVLTKTKEQAESLFSELGPPLAKRGLELSLAKTKVTPVTQGFDFLGFTIKLSLRYGFGNKASYMFNERGEFAFLRKDVMVATATPSKKSLAKVKSSLKDLFFKHVGGSPRGLITNANRVIRGWALSKRAWHCYAAFKHLDNYLYVLQLRFTKRRHPNKGMDWRVHRYFALRKDPSKGYFYKWTFKDPESGHPMLRFVWFWRKRSSGKVIDYPPIKLDVCPDNPSCRDYYCRRQILLSERGYGDLTRNFDIKIATRQSWTCPVCLGSLGSNLGEPLHMHHIVELSNGGKDVPSNIILLHWGCHMKVHHNSSSSKASWKEIFSAIKSGHGQMSMPAPENPEDVPD